MRGLAAQRSAHRLLLVPLVAGALVVTAAGVAAAKPVPGQTSWLVRVTGGIVAGPGGTRTSTLALSPDVVTVKPLDRLGWKDRDDIDEPHLWVFTFDASKVAGRSIDDGKPCPLCDQAKSEMAAALAADPGVTRVEHGRTGGLDAEGDAYLDRLDDDVWLRVLAPTGSVLYYLDAYHPWLSGEVLVSG